MLEIVASFFRQAVIQGIPLLYGSTGEILTEKSGNLNLGIPGIMYIGGIMGVIGAYFYENAVEVINPFLAVLIPFACSFFGSMLMALIYSFLTVTLRANQNVTGLALTTFGTGVGNFFGGSLSSLFGEGGSIALNATGNLYKTTLPFADDLGLFGETFLSFGFLAYLAIAIAIAAQYFLNHTRAGLSLRAVGESPATADAAGINVTKYKYLATCIGGGICGLGGLYIVMNSANGVGGVWVHNCVNGKGWIAVALVIFATWSPARALLGSLVFGALSVMRLYVALGIPAQIYDIFPYIATVIVLVAVSMRRKRENQPPQSLGLAYFREER